MIVEYFCISTLIRKIFNYYIGDVYKFEINEDNDSYKFESGGKVDIIPNTHFNNHFVLKSEYLKKLKKFNVGDTVFYEKYYKHFPSELGTKFTIKKIDYDSLCYPIVISDGNKGHMLTIIEFETFFITRKDKLNYILEDLI